MILALILCLLLLDTLIGNRILPGKTGVVEIKGGYYVYKWHRIMGIPIEKWHAQFIEYEDHVRNLFL